MFYQNLLLFLCKNFQFWWNISKYRPKNSNLDLIFLIKNINSCLQNCKLRIHSKLDRNQSKISVCIFWQHYVCFITSARNIVLLSKQNSNKIGKLHTQTDMGCPFVLCYAQKSVNCKSYNITKNCLVYYYWLT